MRKLKTTDVFEALRLIRKANIREELIPIVKQAAGSGLAVEEVGIDGLLGVIEVLAEKKAERAMYDFLAGPFEISADQVADLSLDELVEKLSELAKENDLKNFISALQGLITRK